MEIANLRGFGIALCLVALILLLVPSSARAGESAGKSGCLSFQQDNTNASMAEILKKQILMPVGPPQTMMLSSGQKVSRQDFSMTGMEFLVGVTVTCTSTCSGNYCSINGCDASSFGCSSCSCFGTSCSSCTCTKTSVYAER